MDSKDPDGSRARGAIENLVAEALTRIEDEGPAALEELCRDHPEHAEDLRARIGWLLETGLAVPEPTTQRQYPERLGDFRLVEPIGHGGMGVVYRAEQLSLGREVALKLVRPEQLYFPGALSRFEQEVATVAGLAHPGIVPIFAVGEEAGVPFFAMEHIRGASLSEVLERLHGRDVRALQGADLVAALEGLGADGAEEPSSLYDGAWPLVCTRLARDVAEALEHAHRRGVLHRDVKPSNVMITRGGRVMLVDFGLSSSEAARDRRTRTGVGVGTLAYMAPEQLRGERELDARVDVYALGVTLYELLALRLPFDSSSEAERRERRDLAVPADLRRTDPRIPWELETVVQTATDPDPARRYATAADLARDLSNVLESRPIEARRASRWLRARRWVQRHPAVAVAVAAAVAGPSVLAWQQMRANERVSAKSEEVRVANEALGAALEDATLQRDAADGARVQAEANLERAFEAVDLMLGHVGGEVLENVPRVEPIRRALLEDALELHEELLAEAATTPEQRAMYARSLRRTAAIHGELGEFDDALAALDREAGVLEELLEERPNAEIQRRRALLDYRRAEVLKLQEKLPEAEAAGRLAVDRLTGLTGSDAVLWSLARARMELADVLRRQGSDAESDELLAAAIEDLRALSERRPGSWDERRELAKALHLRGAVTRTYVEGQDSTFDPGDAEEYLLQSLELRRALAAERPEHPAGLYGVGETAIMLANIHNMERDFAAGGALLQEAYAAFEQLHDAFPARPVYTEGLASVCVNLSVLAAEGDREEERERLLTRAVDSYDGLLADDPTNPDYRTKLSIALGQLGQARVGADPDQGVELMTRSIDVGAPLLERAGTAEGLRTSLGWTVNQLTLAELARGDPVASVAAGRRLLELDPRPVELVWTAFYLASALAVAIESDTPDALLEEWTIEALDLLERAAPYAAIDPRVRQEIVDPGFAPIAEHPRYVALLESLGGR